MSIWNINTSYKGGALKCYVIFRGFSVKEEVFVPLFLKWMEVCTLFICLILNLSFIDCQITNIPSGPIKRLNINKKQMVIGSSSYFVLAYGFNEIIIYLKPLIIKKYYKYPWGFSDCHLQTSCIISSRFLLAVHPNSSLAKSHLAYKAGTSPKGEFHILIGHIVESARWELTQEIFFTLLKRSMK